ncbi:TIGR04104 family putative zinc finger protein [Thalassobacillus devorans]|uniref:TIGR04104 family putative zinc finger protein n=1 Tax=Thalassobacillus devorans TaxID=279813 RepID=UPI0004903330
MTKCKCCHIQFRWGEIFRKNNFYRPIKCRNCGCEHKIDFPSRMIVTSLSVIPFLIFGLVLSPFDNLLFTVIISLAIFESGMILTPFLVNYKPVRK